MNANRAKWYGILSTFVMGILQSMIVYGLFSLFIFQIAGGFTPENVGEFFYILSNILDFFIPVLFFVCLRWSKKIGVKIIIEKENAYKTALYTLNVVMTLAYLLTTLVSLIVISIEEGSNAVFGNMVESFIGYSSVVIFGSFIIIAFNYVPNSIGAIFLSWYLKRFR